MGDLKYLFAYTIPISVIISIKFHGIFSLTTLFYAYGLIPFLELVINDNKNEESEVVISSPFKNFISISIKKVVNLNNI